VRNTYASTPAIFPISLQCVLSHERVYSLSGSNVQMANMESKTNNFSKENVPLGFITVAEVRRAV